MRSNSLLLFDPIETWKKTHLAPGHLHHARTDGSGILRTANASTSLRRLWTSSEYCKKELETLWDESRRLVNPHEVHVDLSNELWHMKAQLLDSYHYTSN